MTDTKGKGWHGDPQGHQQAGQKASDTSEERYGEDFHEKVGSLGGKAAQERGTAHQLTNEERSKGGSMSGGNFANDPQRASEAGKKGGKASSKSDDDELLEEEFE